MATEQFANNAQTTLAASITAVDTSLTVVSAATFPGAPNFRIQIGDELLLVTAVAGTAWTVTRGIESTNAAAHSTGETVTQVLTAGGVNTLIPDQTGNAGKFLTTNGSITSWDAVAAGGTVTSVAMTVPSFLSVTGSPVTTSGTLAVSLSGTALPIANGGTGQTSANAAFNALAPSQASNDKMFLTTDGTNTSWSMPQSGGGVFGAGPDGSVTFDGSSTVLNLVPSSSTYTLANDIYPSAMTVNNGVTILTNGFRIFCSGTLTNNGTITNAGGDGGAGSSGAAGTAGAAGITAGTWAPFVTGDAVKPGTVGYRITSATWNSATAPGNITSPGLGGNGGNGGRATTTQGTSQARSGSTVTPPSAGDYPCHSPYVIEGFKQIANAGTCTSWKAGGGGGCGGGVSQTSTGTCSSGGGGGGGGIVFIAASLLANNGTISANGGNGGNAYVSNTANQAAAGGAGGGGGTMIIITRLLTGNTPTVSGGSVGTDATAGTGSISTAPQAGSSGTYYLLQG